MSYVVNQHNYATPGSSSGLFNDTPSVADKKYFTLHDNVLDGSCFPITGDVGTWGSVMPDSNGVLSTPFVVTVECTQEINAFRLVGSQYNYPVAFTVQFYDGDTILYTITEANNTLVTYVHYMPRLLQVSSYTVSITKVSGSGPVRLYNVYNPSYVKRQDTANLSMLEVGVAAEQHYISSSDVLTLATTHASVPGKDAAVTTHTFDNALLAITGASRVHRTIAAIDTINVMQDARSAVLNTIDRRRDALLIKHSNLSHIHNTIGQAADTLKPVTLENVPHITNIIDRTHDALSVRGVRGVDSAILTNVHSRMKDPSRRIYGKVYITYTDPILASETSVEASSTAYNSTPAAVIDGDTHGNGKLFTLYENNLTGNYVVGDEYTSYGWVSGQVSGTDGLFTDEQPSLTINFSERPIVNLRIVFDASRGAIAENFRVTFVLADGSGIVRAYRGNKSREIVISETITSVVALRITVNKVSKAGYPVAILEIPVVSTFLYVGYQDTSDLVSIDLLEELTYDDEVEALGGISANKVTITLDNSDKKFFFNNSESMVARYLKRNRKIVPWLGVEVIPGEIEWYTLGTYWSYQWDVPVEGLTAKVIGFDTLGLLDTTSFTEHHMQINKSVGELVEYVLTDAKRQLDFVSYKIDAALYDIIIPYAWFEAASHTAALRKISKCYPMHIYCDRDGNICAAPQKLKLDYYYDTWSDNTNVISKNYSSLFTTLPNVINVTVKNPLVVQDKLVEDQLVFNVEDVPQRTLNFSKPYISDIAIVVDCDASVAYTYDVYSWGVTINFTGTGTVRSIMCNGAALDVSNTSAISQRDASSVRLNGAVTRDINSDFIQTSSLATELIRRLLTLSEYDKYDATVDYRGDIALSINDPILLLNGIAPDNRYNIKRHELFWNGSLTGSANLNT